ncbi:acetyl-CoA carboxylase, carboxyl transferase, beta subunit [Desulfitobacterium dichloroeliminans LMG P-21439]|uniref:Acetyl-coenzyme A carboxylase carboxyl transferase subunit beta n=1 Tax=Desulfitobacterium dichloroeliminans (strain LMG P-21439 / DCA1) TaxID=871963 RepID=L0F828_DESDL|nr:acetyl-CoA carboxylase, carboxyltransferase subunit beta [Desulfitobacterium dichloroeliminans]AGA69088.1 acetyl-CoA carboxylase, carboxyl transferase, beta subunit [Desulfitobacterium dichloroeliminans LMG P-21439]
MLKDIFRKKRKYATLSSLPPKPVAEGERAYSSVPVEQGSSRKELPDGLWAKCPKCGEVLFNKDLVENQRVCAQCKYHFRIPARERLNHLIDPGTFEEWDSELLTINPLGFPEYEQKLEEAHKKSDVSESVLTGKASIEGLPVVLAFNEGNFMMGSMGSVTGEKITRAIERAIELRCPVIIFSTSGGARMQEGILSLYQMAKTSAALGRLAKERLLYISVLTDPTFGGVTASYASLGDIHIAEPGALIGFTGPRVIKQTMRKELPEGAQTAEFNQDHGQIDCVVERAEMRATLGRLLRYHQEGAGYGSTL